MSPSSSTQESDKIPYLLATGFFSALCSVLFIYFIASWLLPNYNAFFGYGLILLALAFITGLGIGFLAFRLGAPPEVAMIGATYGWSLALLFAGGLVAGIVVTVEFVEFAIVVFAIFALQVGIGIGVGIIPALVWKLFHRK